MQIDLLLLPFEMNLLVINKFYKAEVVYNRLYEVVSWFDVDFNVFMNTVRQYEQLSMGYEISILNEIIYLKRISIDKKKNNERNLRQNTQGETISKISECSAKLFT